MFITAFGVVSECQNFFSRFEFDSTLSELFAPSNNFNQYKLSNSTLSCQAVNVLTNEI